MARVEIFQPKTDDFAVRSASDRVSKLVKVITLEARRMAARHTGNSYPPATGYFSTTIQGSVNRTGRWTVVGQVGSNNSKALLIHNGSRPHIIRTVNAGGLLFWYKEKGRLICVKQPVHHPGAQGKFYLTVPLRIQGTAAGFRVVESIYTERLFR